MGYICFKDTSLTDVHTGILKDGAATLRDIFSFSEIQSPYYHNNIGRHAGVKGKPSPSCIPSMPESFTAFLQPGRGEVTSHMCMGGVMAPESGAHQGIPVSKAAKLQQEL